METNLTKTIKKDLFNWIHKRQNYGLFVAYEVSIISNFLDHSKGNSSERCDVVSWDGNEHFWCYEIKISWEDFKSNNHISCFGDKNYIVAPLSLAKKIIESHEFDWRFGILAYLPESHDFICYRKCTVQKSIKLADKQLVFEGFAKACARDLNKRIKKENQKDQ